MHWENKSNSISIKWSNKGLNKRYPIYYITLSAGKKIFYNDIYFQMV